MSPAQEKPDSVMTFEAQLEHELDAVEWARRRLRSERSEVTSGEALFRAESGTHRGQAIGNDVIGRAHDSNLLGLALSGGGIRSATFNLGVIQRLAKLKLLHRVDYLSTVSGGGYIGGWLSAWVHRERGEGHRGIRSGILGVEDRLREKAAPEETGSTRLPEPRQVRWLREFSNYLTPRVGALSTDTLTGIATYVRNLILNQAILIAFGATLLILPWLLAALLQSLGGGAVTLGFWLAALLLLTGSFVAGYETLRADLGKRAEDASEKADAWARRAYWILFCSFAAAAVVAGILISYKPSLLGWRWGLFAAAYGFGTSIGWWTAAYRLKKRVPEVDPGKLWLFRPLWALIAAAGLGAILFLWARALDGGTTQLSSPLAAVALGPLVLLSAILLTVTHHVGLAGRRLREAGRELWSSHGAHQMRFGIIWLVFAFSSLFGPLVLMLVDDWIAALGGVTWIVTTAAGVLAGSGATTGARGSSRIAELAARIAPYVFVLGILLVVSYGLHRGIWLTWPPAEGVSPEDVVREESPRRSVYELDLKTATGAIEGGLFEAVPDDSLCVKCYVDESAARVEGHTAELLLAAVTLLVAALFLSWRVDVNVFGFHMFYRNRIERCYLGASNLRRRPHPLTGLDPTDSPGLRDLTLGGDIAGMPPSAHGSVPLVQRLANALKGLVTGTRTEVASERPLPAQRPLPIINAALNITSARNLAWQERKAASFTFTPMYSGYEIREPDGRPLSCYQGTQDYVGDDLGWISLGLPITISGAAASPNAGYHTSAATAFLMTVFNVRLGWWLQNPRYRHQWRKSGPKLALLLLLQELFGATTDKSRYVYLSDGGHFENLGIYELVRRRCRYIIACDAGCDPEYGFEDLGNAIRKCQIDFGIDIEIDPRAVRRDSATGRSGVHCAVGRIRYERVDGNAQPGYLLYLKSSLTGDEPADILQYAAEHAAFPHETTADQWYSESQFESYRKLGDHTAGAVLKDAIAGQMEGNVGSEADLEEVFTALSERWYPPSPQVSASFSKHGEAVEAIFERIRKDAALRFMDDQIYPEWWHLTDAGREGKPAPNPKMLPEDAREIRAGFYLCNSLLQLMENVYHDLDLEQQYRHPDNRGWMNLFRHWSWAGMLRVTWAISASTYGARFQRFCRQRLDLEVGEVCRGERMPLKLLNESDPDLQYLTDEVGVNFLEADHVHKVIKSILDRHGPFSIVQLSLRVISPFEKKKDVAFEFPFAFGLIDTGGEERELLYYRVRDHLREIGFGRKGLALLLEDNAATRLADLDAAEQTSLAAAIPEADYQTLRRLWTSVVVAQEERGYGGLDRVV